MVNQVQAECIPEVLIIVYLYIIKENAECIFILFKYKIVVYMFTIVNRKAFLLGNI